jgi:hypothetical protein
MSHDDEHDVQQWPADEGPPTPEELEAARAFGAAVDRLVAGEAALEGAASDDEQARTATAIRASSGEASLRPERREAILDEALARGFRARNRGPRRLLTVLAAAASVLLVLGAVLLGLQGGRSRSPMPSAAPDEVLSRPSNDLLGRPIEDRAAASGRLDLVFADRLAGYRRVTLGGREWR